MVTAAVTARSGATEMVTMRRYAAGEVSVCSVKIGADDGRLHYVCPRRCCWSRTAGLCCSPSALGRTLVI